MSNYPDMESRLERLENSLENLRREVELLARRLDEITEEIRPAVETQRIHGSWYDFQ